MSTLKISSYFFLIDLHFKFHTAYNNLLVFHYASKNKEAKLQGYLNTIHIGPHSIALFILSKHKAKNSLLDFHTESIYSSELHCTGP